VSAWEVGDLALCVAVPKFCPCGCGESMLVTKGQVLRVTKVLGDSGLCFEGIPNETVNHYGIKAKYFRKIKPDTEPCEEEFTVLIKRGRRVQA